MESLAEEVRLERIQQAFEHWQRMSDSRRTGAKSDEEREDEYLIGPLIPYVAKEIVAAIRENRVARVFCELWYVEDLLTGECSVYGDDGSVIREGRRDVPVEHVSTLRSPLVSISAFRL